MPLRALRTILVALAAAGGSAMAQQPAPPGMSLARAAAKRFPQPVRVGALIGRTVLEPLESQPILGHVRQIVRLGDGTIEAVVAYDGFLGRFGGVLGIGSRPIAVPIDAMALAGQYMEIVDFKPSQLRTFPTFSGAGATSIAPDDFIRVGLARPSH